MQEPTKRNLEMNFGDKDWKSIKQDLIQVKNGKSITAVLNTIKDWHNGKISLSRLDTIEEACQLVIDYDEVYVSEDVRRSINRMKNGLIEALKNLKK